MALMCHGCHAKMFHIVRVSVFLRRLYIGRDFFSKFAQRFDFSIKNIGYETACFCINDDVDAGVWCGECGCATE